MTRFEGPVRPATMPCGKVGYHTRKIAGAAARNTKLRVRLHVYRCPDERCSALPWHLTKHRYHSPTNNARPKGGASHDQGPIKEPGTGKVRHERPEDRAQERVARGTRMDDGQADR